MLRDTTLMKLFDNTFPDNSNTEYNSTPIDLIIF